MARKPKVVKEPRRKPGTGAIRTKRGRDTPYEAEWTHADGSAEYRGFRSRPEAAQWLDSMVADRASGRNLIGGAMPFSQFIQEWLAIKLPKVSKKTAHGYTYMCSLASGQIGTMRIESITLHTLEHMFIYFHTKEEPFKNLSQLRNPLRQAFKYAKKMQYITDDPTEGLELPDVERKPITALTEAQRAHVLDLARDEHDTDIPLLPLWHLYSRLGLRKGEGIGLRWSSIDWEARTLTIQESVTNVGKDNLRGKTKTKRPRVVPIPADLYDLLKIHQDEQRRRGLFGSVFVDADGETVTPQHVQYRWQELRERAGVPGCTIHGLRHTALSILALAGVPENVRMAMAGHSSAGMAEHYSNHATIEDIRKFVG